MESTPVQVFVRNDKGKIWGPLELPTVELLIDNGLIDGRLQVSQDGVHFAFPGRFPGIRDYFPRSLWGEIPADAGAAPAPKQAAPAPAILLGADPEPEPSQPATRPPGAPIAGPGAPAGGPGALQAGPGARAAAQTRAAPRGSAPGNPPPRVAPAAVFPSSSPGIAPIAPPVASVAPVAPVAPPIAPPPAAAATAGSQAAPPHTPGNSPPEAPREPLPATGDLAKISALHLYYLAAAGEHTTQITFRLSDREIAVHFRKGNPDSVESTHPEDSIGTFLLKSNIATPSQIAQAEAEQGRFGGELIGALFGLGILNPGSTFAQIAQRAQGLLLKALVAESGSFGTEPKDLPPHKVIPLGNRWAVLAEATRRIPAAELRRKLQPVMDLPIMKSGGRVQVADLRLTPQETRALAYIDGVRSLSQLAKDLPQEIDHLFRLAFLLRDLEIVSFAAVPQRAPEPPKPAPPPAAAAPKPPEPAKPAGTSGPKPAPAPARPPPAAAAPKPPPAAAKPPEPAKPAEPPKPVDHAADLKELRARAAKLKEQNLFQVLGLDEKADSNAVKVAYFKAARIYHPDTVAPDAPPEIGKLKGEIFAAVGDAYRKLTDDKSRAEYLEELKTGGSEKVDIQQILMAEELFQKGCIMVKARKFPEAVKMLDDAIKANDKEGEFYAWRGYAKYFAAADKAVGKQEAQKDFGIALKLNERVGSLHYFMGHITKLSGDNTGAMKHFKKAVEYQPDHVDALRELRGTGAKR